MIISEMITELGYELDRSDIDTRIKLWMQQAINKIYNFHEWTGLKRSWSPTIVASTQAYDLPKNIAKIYSVTYDSGDGIGHRLVGITKERADLEFAGSTVTGIPNFYWLYNGKIYFHSIPASTYTITVSYSSGSPTIYHHNLNITDDDNAATTGVAIYFDEDAVNSKTGKFYFVSPTTTDAIVRLASASNHQHDLKIYHSADAATLGVAVYVDDDGTNSYERMLFVSPTQADGYCESEAFRGHTHYMQLVDDDDVATNGTQLYLDEDDVSKTARILSVTAGDANTTIESVLAHDNGIFPFTESFHDLMYLCALYKGLFWTKQYAEAKERRGEFYQDLLEAKNKDTTKLSIRPRPTGFGMGTSPASVGDHWKIADIRSDP